MQRGVHGVVEVWIRVRACPSWLVEPQQRVQRCQVLFADESAQHTHLVGVGMLLGARFVWRE